MARKTSGTYEKTHRLDVNPKRVMLFTLKSSDKKVWYVRILRKEGNGYFQKSLKTTKIDVAKEMAKNLYMEMWSSEEKGIEFTDGRFTTIFQEFLEAAAFARGRHKRAVGIFNRYFSEFFGQTPVGQLDSKMFNEYLRWRCEYWDKREQEGFVKGQQLNGMPVYNYSKVPSETTLKFERQLFKQFLFFCAENHYIESVPALKVNLDKVRGVKYKSERRRAKAISEKQEKRIEKLLRDFCLDYGQEDKNWIRCFGRARMYYFIYICRHTLIRPTTEATGLKWRDVTTEESRKYTHDDGTPYKLALINVRDAKTGNPRVCVMPYGQVHLLTTWRKMSAEWGFGFPEDYVFPNWKGDRTEAAQIGRFLSDKLKEWGEHRTKEKDGYNEPGQVITLYSLARHTAITRRIERSRWDVGQVATAAGTSIMQISKYYYESFVRADPDRWAVTFASGIPKLTDKRKQKIEDEVAEWEKLIEGFNEDE